MRGFEPIRSEFLPDLLGGGGELRLVGHDAGVRLQLRALFARDDVDVEVEHGLARCRAVELRDQHAVSAYCFLDRRAQLLHHGHQFGEPLWRHVEQVAGGFLGDHQRVAFGTRHDVEEGKRILVLVDLVAGELAAQHLGEDVVRVVGH